MSATFTVHLIEGPVEESRPCTCGGSNENCYRCSGTGIIQRRVNVVQPSSPTRQRKGFDLSGLLRRFGTKKAKQAAERSAASRMIQCDRCKFRGLPEEVKSHAQKAHATKESLDRPGIIDRYSTRKRHGNGRKTPTPVLAASSRKHLIACPICRSNVKATRFRKHLSKVHGHTVGPVPPSRSRKSRRKQAARHISRTPSAPVPADDLQIIDQREAHRQMGFVVRENGRYGSHPLHDRFDDESEP
jgi:hypothetical protein